MKTRSKRNEQRDKVEYRIELAFKKKGNGRNALGSRKMYLFLMSDLFL